MGTTAQNWQINESTAFRNVRRVEQTLIRSGRFSLPGKKTLVQPDSTVEVAVVDVTETPVERPKNQRRVYSGKKKQPTLKTQLVVNQQTGAMICTAQGKGHIHDFRLFATSRVKLATAIRLLADKGDQGIVRFHANSQIPTKKPKGEKLSRSQRQANRALNRQRIVVEHVNRCLKIFRILSERYRNRRRRFGLRLNLIAGIYNFELKLSS